jgi:zinc-ribbon domain
MRCPSCGTENAPDSRFCGGCGLRFAVSGQRLAPTQKIDDDASFPQRASAPAQAAPATHLTTLPGPPPPRPLPPPAFPGAIAPPAFPGSIAPPAFPGAIAPPAFPGAIAPPAFPGSIAPPAFPGAIAPPAFPGSPPPAPSPPRAVSSAPPSGYQNGRAPIAAAPAPHAPPASAVTFGGPSSALPVVARRPWGLIVAVLLLDTGLAVAGAWMLREGLASAPGSGATR